MFRSRKSDLDRSLDTITGFPWWGSVVFGGVVFVICWATLVSLPPNHSAQVLRSSWWIVPLLFGGWAIGSFITTRRSRKKLHQIRNLRDLQRLESQDFERLTTAYYYESGLAIAPTNESGQTDSGFNIVLWKEAERILVKCAKGARDPIGVQEVREFFGVVVAEGADRGVFLTTGRFTPEAMEFGLRHTILEMIPGERFVQMLAQLRAEKAAAEAPIEAGEDEAAPTVSTVPAVPGAPCHTNALPGCPVCRKLMVPRVVRTGPSAGRQFWGCQRYPVCDGTRSVF